VASAGKAGRLRKQAQRALRLARAIGDERAASALRVHAANLIEQADSLERQQTPVPAIAVEQPRPLQQQQQLQPKDEDKET